MLVGMIGAPGAGKTTLALSLVLELKKRGYPAIYLEEYATRHILLCELDEMIANHQAIIQSEQAHLEEVYDAADRIVVCDSSRWLNHFYMCSLTGQDDRGYYGDYRADDADELKEHYDLLFFVLPHGRPGDSVGRLPEHEGDDERARIHNQLYNMCRQNKVEPIGIKAREVEDAVGYVLRRWKGERE